MTSYMMCNMFTTAFWLFVSSFTNLCLKTLFLTFDWTIPLWYTTLWVSPLFEAHSLLIGKRNRNRISKLHYMYIAIIPVLIIIN